jgi:trk system potassium uptake protein TrkH
MNVILLEAILGRLLTAYGLVMLIPLGVAVYCKESALWAFLFTIGITVALGILMRLHGKIQGKMGVREGFAAVAGAWILASLFGALPYVLSGDIPSYIDAVFETASGLTTTGASVLTDLENFPRSILLWRSLTHWLGGMGIIVLFIVLLPNIGIGAVHLFNAEVPGPISEKVLPKIKDTALVLWSIYAGFTLLEIILLCLAGMTFYDSVNHAFATMATGGFSTRTASVAAFDSAAIELIIVFFMIIAGANFNIFIFALRQRSLKVFKDTEFKYYIFIVVLAFLAVTGSLVFQQGTGLLPAMRQSIFQVVSIMTTTVFATADFDQWPGLAKLILFFLMFVGGAQAQQRAA